MTSFIIGAAVAILLALALMLRPFFRLGRAAESSQRQLNAAILREQLAKLELDLAEGTLRSEDYDQARTELQRRVLEDTREEDAAPTLRAPRRTLVALAVVLPLAAAALYYTIGSPESMKTPALAQRPSEQDIERMVQALAERLAKEPGNLKGWAMLGRAYKLMGRSVDAEQAFGRAGAFVEDDAQLLAEYADVAVANANGSFAGKPIALIDKALKVDPNNPMALWLAGTAAFREKDYVPAIGYWERLLAFLPPGSDEARNLQGSIQEMRTLANANANANANGMGPADSGKSVSGTVELAPSLKAQASPGDTVMVIARVPGTRMPVAVLRVRAADLPLKFTLDDSLAMSPQARISGASEVEVEARISRSGLAKPEPGDLISGVQTVKVGARDVALRVAQVRN